ncbi:MAG: MotA/TolQ/ExbB proton channel family protein [Desulfarculaceae bacterium]|jgi:biopolymer transport protein ExbB
MSALDSLWRFIVAGGPVMFPLIVLSLWMWGLVLVKMLWLLRIAREEVRLADLLECLDKGSEPPWTWAPAGWAVEQFLTLRSHEPETDLLYWNASVLRQIPLLWRHLTTLLMLSGVAPLLGLLGTVAGMISTFEVIGQFGTGNAQALAAGISEALITTETGLLIAVPGLFASYMMRRRIRREQQKLLGIKEAVNRWIREKEVALCYA